MAVLLKKRLFNPSKRRLTARQKLFFGSKKQRAAAKRTLSNKGHRTRTRNSGRKRVRNIGEIITLSLPKKRRVISNPMPKASRTRRSNSSARRARRRNAPKTWSGLYQRAYKKKRKNPSSSHRRRRANSSTTRVVRRRRNPSKTRTIIRYRNPSRRRKNYSRSHRRRNPAFLTGNLTKVAGILGGAALTNLIAKQVPVKYTTGTLGYATLTAIALGQGWLVKKVLKNDALAEDIMIGGLVLVAIKVMSDFFPSISLGLSGRGLGLIGNSSFPIPQVPVAGSMGRFMIPPNYQSAINAAIPAVPTGTRGLGAITMGGSTRARRVGRIN